MVYRLSRKILNRKVTTAGRGATVAIQEAVAFASLGCNLSSGQPLCNQETPMLLSLSGGMRTSGNVMVVQKKAVSL